METWNQNTTFGTKGVYKRPKKQISEMEIICRKKVIHAVIFLSSFFHRVFLRESSITLAGEVQLTVKQLLIPFLVKEEKFDNHVQEMVLFCTTD